MSAARSDARVWRGYQQRLSQQVRPVAHCVDVVQLDQNPPHRVPLQLPCWHCPAPEHNAPGPPHVGAALPRALQSSVAAQMSAGHSAPTDPQMPEWQMDPSTQGSPSSLMGSVQGSPAASPGDALAAGALTVISTGAVHATPPTTPARFKNSRRVVVDGRLNGSAA